MNLRYYEYVELLKKRGSAPGLEQIRALLDELGHPERKLNILHIAGTNGKGSVFAYLASILREAGYRVGRYVSPTIRSYEERFQIDGREISAARLEQYFGTVRRAMEAVERRGEKGATLFEAETALSFLWFAEEEVDFALIETGMGGELDATNVIEKPMLTVLSSISEDHKEYLGDTVEEIARQKAGILKRGVPVIVGENAPEVKAVIKEVAAERKVPVIEAETAEVMRETGEETTFIWKKQKFQTFLPGRHQVSNAVTALTAAWVLGERILPEGKITGESMEKGVKNTRWPGRLELLRRFPHLYRDGAHNPDGALKLSQFLEKHFTNNRILYIMGVLKDKEYEKMLDILAPGASGFYVFRPDNDRGLSGEVLSREIRKRGRESKVCKDVNEALRLALEEAGPEDVLAVCGSLSFMEAMEDTTWK
ncbi:MAG: folylpolyglutamate synthase/dihydrofolate synthase family protein [Eubacteriales bacterium]|nr:folylpolyglutamate synthase/dihydrofolate synthase family protein [Eubacteriales bacterium]